VSWEEQRSYICLAFRHSFATHVNLPMSRASAPTLRRKNSSSDGSCVDPYDKAEQGFQIGLEDLSGVRPPLEPKKTFSFRSSLRSSDSTLVDFPSHEDFVDDPRRPLPRQGKCHDYSCLHKSYSDTNRYTNYISTRVLHNSVDNKVFQ
jgi:hypothetical protein